MEEQCTVPPCREREGENEGSAPTLWSLLSSAQLSVFSQHLRQATKAWTDMEEGRRRSYSPTGRRLGGALMSSSPLFNLQFKSSQVGQSGETMEGSSQSVLKITAKKSTMVSFSLLLHLSPQFTVHPGCQEFSRVFHIAVHLRTFS